jgi:hypothetical protein
MTLCQSTLYLSYIKLFSGTMRYYFPFVNPLVALTAVVLMGALWVGVVKLFRSGNYYKMLFGYVLFLLTLGYSVCIAYCVFLATLV